jgi:hypothetical protein
MTEHARQRHWSIDLTMRPEYIEATIIHMPTSESVRGRAVFDDYREQLEDPAAPLTDDRREILAREEAIGRLFAWMSEMFDCLGEEDTYPGEYDGDYADLQPDLRVLSYGVEPWSDDASEATPERRGTNGLTRPDEM